MKHHVPAIESLQMGHFDENIVKTWLFNYFLKYVAGEPSACLSIFGRQNSSDQRH